MRGSSRLKCTIASFCKRILLNPKPSEVETEAKCWSIKASGRLFGDGRSGSKDVGASVLDAFPRIPCQAIEVDLPSSTSA